MKHKLIILTALLIATGCAHGLMRGTVAMKVDDQDAHVCLGEGEVKAGDRVNLFRNECVSRGGGRVGTDRSFCKKVKIGEGVVSQTLNEHYSLVKVDPGVTFEEGTIVERP